MRRYSFSALLAYAIAMLFSALLAVLGDINYIEKVALAISAGGYFIIVGDLLSKPYLLSVERYNCCVELEIACDIFRKTVNIDNHFIDGEKVADWLQRKENEATSEKEKHERNIKIENILSCLSVISTTIGFSLLLLIMGSPVVFTFLEPIQPVITIISFFLLILTLILGEEGKRILGEMRKDKENVAKISHKLLCPEKYANEHYEGHNRDGE